MGVSPTCSDGHPEASIPGSFQHSPSFHMQSESFSKMLHFGRGKSLGEGVHNYVIGWAINEVHRSTLNDPVDEMILHIDVLCVQMVLVVTCEGNGGLVV